MIKETTKNPKQLVVNTLKNGGDIEKGLIDTFIANGKNLNKTEKYLLKQEWQKIITHNKDGEYSHDQHILVHRIVSTILFNNNVNYKDFKVFDFSNDILNDISLPEKNLRKYYLLKGNLLEFNSHKVFTRKEEPMNYDMTNVLCE